MQYLIAAIIGAIIGYITNWLAIKMLFRPYTEKRFFGIRLPFTPGLIPKERFRIAKSVGETIGDHLLTNDTLVDALRNDKMNEHTKKLIKDKISEVGREEKTLKEKLDTLLGDKSSDVLARVNKGILSKVQFEIHNEKTKKQFKDWIKAFILDKTSVSMEDVVNGHSFQCMQKVLTEKLMTGRKSEKLEIMLRQYMQEKLLELENSSESIKEIVPSGASDTMEMYIYNSREQICEAINDMLKDPEVSISIKGAMATMISDNLNSFIAGFIKVDSVYEKLLHIIDEYFQEDENRKNTIKLISNAVEKLGNNKISDVLSKASEEDKELVIKGLVDLFIENILTEEIIKRLIEQIKQGLITYKTLNELLITLDEGYSDKVTDFILESIYSEVLQKPEVIEEFSLQTVDAVINTSVKDILGDNEEDLIMVVQLIWDSVFEKFIEEEAAGVVAAMDIPKIVEERLNSFEVSFAEELIVKIANKELSAITWLGALLGGIIGVLSPILSSLY